MPMFWGPAQVYPRPSLKPYFGFAQNALPTWLKGLQNSTYVVVTRTGPTTIPQISHRNAAINTLMPNFNRLLWVQIGLTVCDEKCSAHWHACSDPAGAGGGRPGTSNNQWSNSVILPSFLDLLRFMGTRLHLKGIKIYKEKLMYNCTESIEVWM